jgi:hypothetical protein
MRAGVIAFDYLLFDNRFKRRAFRRGRGAFGWLLIFGFSHVSFSCGFRWNAQ